MATERVGGVVKVLELMDKADTTPQDMQKFYAEYCKTYDKVTCIIATTLYSDIIKIE